MLHPEFIGVEFPGRFVLSDVILHGIPSLLPGVPGVPRLPSGGYETLFFLISSFYLIPLKKSMDSRKSNLDKITPLYYS